MTTQASLRFSTATVTQQQISARVAIGSLAGFDAAVLLRYSPGGADSTTLLNFILGGGTLITEWNASVWALNTVGLLSATDTGGGFVGTGTDITITAAGLSAGLGTGLSNPYSDSPRSEFFRDFSALGVGIDLLATRPGGIPVIFGGASGLGRTYINSSDWADSFPTGASTSGQMLLNLLAIDDAPPAAVPEPGTWAMMFGGLAVFAVSRRFKR